MKSKSYNILILQESRDVVNLVSQIGRRVKKFISNPVHVIHNFYIWKHK